MIPDKPRLPARVFYAGILAGAFLGLTAFMLGGWLYLEHGGEPAGRLWADLGKWFVIPVCAMMGTTFGGLAGFVAAVMWEYRQRTD